jgi:cytidylate kinase
MKKSIVVAVDGPAGAGKSTVCKQVAANLGIQYIDSGAFYRTITKNILDSRIKIDDYVTIEKLLNNITLELVNGKVLLNTKDYSEFIRSTNVTLNVSPVSNNLYVRKKVNWFLQNYALGKSIIMDGRDIGTVVFPNADYKFYLDASIEARANRRYEEKTMDLSLADIKDAIIKRDENDRNKAQGALKIADDAIYIDTTNLSIDNVVDQIIKKIKNM